jgi:membrane protease YdiL (CAAX protease family)
MFQAAERGSGERPNALIVYASLLVGELALIYVVARGIRRSGHSIQELIGGQWRTPRQVGVDIALAFLTWGAIKLFAVAWDKWIPIRDHARSIGALLPVGPTEIVIWIALSVVAGAAEEIVFRGYFQRQFAAWLRSPVAALFLQALLFGVTHGYQGIAACIRITVIGSLFGALTLWRRSLRPGIVAHAMTDIMSGVFRI